MAFAAKHAESPARESAADLRPKAAQARLEKLHRLRQRAQAGQQHAQQAQQHHSELEVVGQNPLLHPPDIHIPTGYAAAHAVSWGSPESMQYVSHEGLDSARQHDELSMRSHTLTPEDSAASTAFTASTACTAGTEDRLLQTVEALQASIEHHVDGSCRRPLVKQAGTWPRQPGLLGGSSQAVAGPLTERSRSALNRLNHAHVANRQGASAATPASARPMTAPAAAPAPVAANRKTGSSSQRQHQQDVSIRPKPLPSSKTAAGAAHNAPRWHRPGLHPRSPQQPNGLPQMRWNTPGLPASPPWQQGTLPHRTWQQPHSAQRQPPRTAPQAQPQDRSMHASPATPVGAAALSRPAGQPPQASPIRGREVTTTQRTAAATQLAAAKSICPRAASPTQWAPAVNAAASAPAGDSPQSAGAPSPGEAHPLQHAGHGGSPQPGKGRSMAEMIRRFREAPPRSRADRQRLASVRASLEAGPSPVAEGSTDQFWWQQEASSVRSSLQSPNRPRHTPQRSPAGKPHTPAGSQAARRTTAVANTSEAAAAAIAADADSEDSIDAVIARAKRSLGSDGPHSAIFECQDTGGSRAHAVHAEHAAAKDDLDDEMHLRDQLLWMRLKAHMGKPSGHALPAEPSSSTDVPIATVPIAARSATDGTKGDICAPSARSSNASSIFNSRADEQLPPTRPADGQLQLGSPAKPLSPRSQGTEHARAAPVASTSPNQACPGPDSYTDKLPKATAAAAVHCPMLPQASAKNVPAAADAAVPSADESVAGLEGKGTPAGVRRRGWQGKLGVLVRQPGDGRPETLDILEAWRRRRAAAQRSDDAQQAEQAQHAPSAASPKAADANAAQPGCLKAVGDTANSSAAQQAQHGGPPASPAGNVAHHVSQAAAITDGRSTEYLQQPEPHALATDTSSTAVEEQHLFVDIERACPSRQPSHLPFPKASWASLAPGADAADPPRLPLPTASWASSAPGTDHLDPLDPPEPVDPPLSCSSAAKPASCRPQPAGIAAPTVSIGTSTVAVPLLAATSVPNSDTGAAASANTMPADAGASARRVSTSAVAVSLPAATRVPNSDMVAAAPASALSAGSTAPASAPYSAAPRSLPVPPLSDATPDAQDSPQAAVQTIALSHATAEPADVLEPAEAAPLGISGSVDKDTTANDAESSGLALAAAVADTRADPGSALLGMADTRANPSSSLLGIADTRAGPSSALLGIADTRVNSGLALLAIPSGNGMASGEAAPTNSTVANAPLKPGMAIPAAAGSATTAAEPTNSAGLVAATAGGPASAPVAIPGSADATSTASGAVLAGADPDTGVPAASARLPTPEAASRAANGSEPPGWTVAVADPLLALSPPRIRVKRAPSIERDAWSPSLSFLLEDAVESLLFIEPADASSAAGAAQQSVLSAHSATGPNTPDLPQLPIPAMSPAMVCINSTALSNTSAAHEAQQAQQRLDLVAKELQRLSQGPWGTSALLGSSSKPSRRTAEHSAPSSPQRSPVLGSSGEPSRLTAQHSAPLSPQPSPAQQATAEGSDTQQLLVAMQVLPGEGPLLEREHSLPDGGNDADPCWVDKQAGGELLDNEQLLATKHEEQLSATEHVSLTAIADEISALRAAAQQAPAADGCQQQPQHAQQLAPDSADKPWHVARRSAPAAHLDSRQPGTAALPLRPLPDTRQQCAPISPQSSLEGQPREQRAAAGWDPLQAAGTAGTPCSSASEAHEPAGADVRLGSALSSLHPKQARDQDELLETAGTPGSSAVVAQDPPNATAQLGNNAVGNQREDQDPKQLTCAAGSSASKAQDPAGALREGIALSSQHQDHDQAQRQLACAAGTSEGPEAATVQLDSAWGEQHHDQSQEQQQVACQTGMASSVCEEQDAQPSSCGCQQTGSAPDLERDAAKACAGRHLDQRIGELLDQADQELGAVPCAGRDPDPEPAGDGGGDPKRCREFEPEQQMETAAATRTPAVPSGSARKEDADREQAQVSRPVLDVASPGIPVVDVTAPVIDVSHPDQALLTLLEAELRSGKLSGGEAVVQLLRQKIQEVAVRLQPA